MSSIWIAALGRHLAVLVTGALIGGLYGVAIIGLLIAALVLLAWHLLNLFRLEHWLQTGDIAEMPSGNGIWARVFARVKYFDSKVRLNQKKYRQLIKELRKATKVFPDGGVILNMSDEIITCNKAACVYLGLKRKRDRGLRIDNFIRYPRFVSFLREGGEREMIEIPSPVGDKWLSCRLIPYGPEQRLLLVSDITLSKKLETARTDFVANASHELRTPLTVISGYLDAMHEDTDMPESWAGPVTDMCEQAERMKQLVADLLQLSKLESSATSSMDRSIDMAAILSSARKEALAENPDLGAVKVDLQSDAGLLGEESEIQSVVSNLVSNAVRYTLDDGHILIRWDVDEAGGHLLVEDDGIGIAPEDIPRLTERFFRADDGRARQKGGTGLGLAIVKYALRRHDAELEIMSEPGQGSRFMCHFAPQRITYHQ